MFNLGEKIAAKVKNSEDLGEKLEFLKDGISEAVKEFISITFENAEVNDLIVNEPSFNHLEFFDPGAIFTADMDSLQVAKVMSMITNVQEQVTALANKNTPSTNSNVDGALLSRIENVRNDILSP